MKILLINPITYNSIENFIKDSKRMKINADEPLSIMTLSSYIKQQLPEIEIEVFDWHIECLKEMSFENSIYHSFKGKRKVEFLNQILEFKIKEFKPDVIGISALYEYNSQIVLDMFKFIKEIDKNIITVIGGIFPTTNNLFKNNDIDYIIDGEGELNFYYFLKDKIEKNKTNIKIYNTYGYLKDINLLPLPDRDIKNIGMYNIYGRQSISRFVDGNVKTATIQTDRGCSSTCTFCSGHNITNRDFRHRSVENIINEIKDLKEKYDIKYFIFNSENACGNVKFSKELFKALIPLNINWLHNGGFYINLMDEEFINLAIDSGIIMFNLAFESGSTRILKMVKKPESIVYKAEQVIKWIRNKNDYIYCIGFFMFGFAEETWQDVNDSIEFMKKLDLNWYQINMLQVFKGCKLYDKYKELNLIEISENNDSQYIESKVKNINGIDRKELSDYVYEKVNIDLNFKNNRDFRYGNFEQVKRDMNHILNITNGKHEEANKLLQKINEVENV
jgi:anaerobic magnesium-protoporphyrin IX monomethyl ester cyclase